MKGPQINYLLRIDALWAAVSVDDDGTEGLVASFHNDTWLPLITADENRLPLIIAQAERVAATQGRLIRIIKLHSREEVRAIDGRQ